MNAETGNTSPLTVAEVEDFLRTGTAERDPLATA
jgi:hypothetical protein